MRNPTSKGVNWWGRRAIKQAMSTPFCDLKQVSCLNRGLIHSPETRSFEGNVTHRRIFCYSKDIRVSFPLLEGMNRDTSEAGKSRSLKQPQYSSKLVSVVRHNRQPFLHHRLPTLQWGLFAIGTCRRLYG